MDPNKTIRPWLLSVGETFGAREAFDTHWDDADRHPAKPYFEYTVMSARNYEVGHRGLNAVDGTDVTFSACQAYEIRVMVDLYRDEDGLVDLARCCVAANHNQAIKNIFETHGVAFSQIDGDITNESQIENDSTDDFPLYHHRMTVVFRENIEYEIEQVDAAVSTIVLTIAEEFNTYQIDDSGVELIP